MTLTEELTHIKAEYPKAWEYMREIREKSLLEGFHNGVESATHAELPHFDDNDEMIEEDE